jgi:mono/diheme cytochrome c family protein
MNLPNEHSPRNRSDSVARRAGSLCLFAVCLVAVTAFACSKDSGSGAAQASTSAAAESTATPAKTGDTVTVASGTYCDTPNDSAEVWNNANHHRDNPLSVSQQEYDGWKMFHVYCYRCHGTDAMGSDIAPNLRHSLGPEGGVNKACFITTVWNGRPPKGMPTWSTLLDSTQINNLYAYVTARSMGGLAPGRPHVGQVSK